MQGDDGADAAGQSEHPQEAETDETGENAGNTDADATSGGPMNMTGDMNQMQMMMAMQNGMAPNSFGSFPMMGSSPPPTSHPPSWLGYQC